MLRTEDSISARIHVINDLPDLAHETAQLPPAPLSTEMPRVSLSGTNNSLSAFSYQETPDTGAPLRHLRVMVAERDGLRGVDQIIPLQRDDYKRVIGIFQLCQQESIDIAGPRLNVQEKSVPTEREIAIFQKLNLFTSSLSQLAERLQVAQMNDSSAANTISSFMARSSDAQFYR